MPCKLAITFPELIEGEVHAAVVHQVPGDGQGVSLRNALLQQALTENYHDALPVTARYLRRESFCPLRCHSETGRYRPSMSV